MEVDPTCKEQLCVSEDNGVVPELLFESEIESLKSLRILVGIGQTFEDVSESV